MQQHEFIYIVNNMQAEKRAEQDENGNVNIALRSQIKLSHNYKKNEMVILFIDDNTTFKFSSRQELEEIGRIHLANKDAVEPLRRYCEEHLERF